MNENEREYKGVKLVAKEYDGCRGCFLEERSIMECEEFPCRPSQRLDKKSIIWIEKQTELQPQASASSRQERIATAFNITTGKDLSADDIELIEFLTKKIK